MYCMSSENCSKTRRPKTVLSCWFVCNFFKKKIGGRPSMHLVALTKGVDTHKFLSWTFSHACHQMKTNSRNARVYKLQIYQNTYVVNIETRGNRQWKLHTTSLSKRTFSQTVGAKQIVQPHFPLKLRPQSLRAPNL